MRTPLLVISAAVAFVHAVAATTPKFYGNSTSASSAQLTTSCAINTVYVPITVTETVTASLEEATLQGAAVGSSSPRTSYDADHSTSTRTSTHTSVITLLYASTSQAFDGGDTTKYYYFMTDGTTSWLHGMSPTGLVLMTETTTMTTFITAAAEPLITTTVAGSTPTETDTVTPPAYTTTIYSMASTSAEETDDPGHTSTTRITSWSTITETSTATRTSFTGLGTIGWNSTTTTPDAYSTLSQDPTITATLVESVFWGVGSLTTRTSTTLITTTLTEQTTILVTPSLTASGDTASAETSTNTTGSATVSLHHPDTSTLGTTSTSNRPFTYFPMSSTGSSGISEASSSTASRGVGPSVKQTYSSHLETSLATANPKGTYSINAQGVSSSSSTTASVPLTTHHSITATVTGTVQTVASPANTTTSAAVVPLVNGTTTLYVSVSSVSSTLHAPASSAYTTTASRGDNVTAAQESTTSGVPTDTYSGSGPHSFGVTVSSVRTTTTSMTSSRRAPSPNPSDSAVHGSSGSVGARPSAYTSSLINTTMSALSTSTGGLTSSSTSLGPSPTPSVCGEHGNFMIDFDDLPTFDPGSNASDITQRPPVTVFRPYRHLTFSNGYVYAPLPVEPYQPVSRPNVGVFLANGTNKLSRNRPGILPGEFGTVDGQDAMSAFWFDAWSAYFGCDVGGPSECVLVISAYQFSQDTKDEVLADSYNTTIEACTSRRTSGGNCEMQQVGFPDTFRNMTGLQVAAYVDGQQRMWFVDNLALAWSDNSCAAGLLRQRSP